VVKPPINNIHGRKPGRGLRPWMLLPKYLCVSLIIGGLFAMALSGWADNGQNRFDLMRSIVNYQIFPASILATLLGIGLLLQHPRQLLAMPWLWAKLVILGISILLFHILLKPAIATSSADASLLAIICCGGFALTAILARLKPRFWHRTNPPGN